MPTNFWSLFQAIGSYHAIYIQYTSHTDTLMEISSEVMFCFYWATNISWLLVTPSPFIIYHHYLTIRSLLCISDVIYDTWTLVGMCRLVAWQSTLNYCDVDTIPVCFVGLSNMFMPSLYTHMHAHIRTHTHTHYTMITVSTHILCIYMLSDCTLAKLCDGHIHYNNLEVKEKFDVIPTGSIIVQVGLLNALVSTIAAPHVTGANI